MKTVTDPKQLMRRRKPVILAAGFFDGLHRGHLKVIERTIAEARSLNGEAWALTFGTHPQRVLNPRSAPKLLTCNPHKLLLMSRAGLDGCLLMPFTHDLAMLSPQQFLDTLTSAAPTLARILVGSNWRFGRGGQGSVAMLRRMAGRAGIAVSAVRPATYQGQPISSTRIRAEVAKGRLSIVEHMLGRPFSIFGTVVRGRRLGRRLGFPTANLDPHNEVLPPCGVYAARALLHGRLVDGVINLGFAPTVGPPADSRPTLEVFLLGVDAKLYGEEIELFFVERLRKERKYGSLETLQRQIALDVRHAQELLSKKRTKNPFTHASPRIIVRPGIEKKRTRKNKQGPVNLHEPGR